MKIHQLEQPLESVWRPGLGYRFFWYVEGTEEECFDIIDWIKETNDFRDTLLEVHGSEIHFAAMNAFGVFIDFKREEDVVAFKLRFE